MTPTPSATLAIALGLGVSVALVCQRVRIPGLLPLMLTGMLFGPAVLGVIDAGQLGGALSAFISLAVGILIFEGSLHLDRETLSHAPRAMRGLLTVGVLVTWTIATILAYTFADLPLDLALVLGAALTVTGPTVVQPMLRRVPLTPRVHSLLASEAILVDPIGVVATIATMELVLGRQLADIRDAPVSAVAGYLLPLLAGSALGALLGLVGSWVVTRPIWRGRAGDEGVSIASLGVLALAVGFSELVLHESGLVAAAVAGLVYARLAKRRLVALRRAMENISGVLVAVLFVLLASRIDVGRLAEIGPGEVMFVAGLILIARPLCIFIGTAGGGLRFRERLMASFMAPRGIVAVSLASIVATEIVRVFSAGADTNPDVALAAAAMTAHAQRLESLLILVVLVTVAITSIFTGPVARLLRVRAGPPNGLLIVGGHLLGRELGRVLKELNIPAVLVDSNAVNVARAAQAGLSSYQGDATDSRWLQEVVLSPQIGMVFAATDNSDVDGVVARWGLEHFGPGSAFRWSRPTPEQSRIGDADLSGLPVAAPDYTLRDVLTGLNSGALSLNVWTGPRPASTPILVVQNGRLRPVPNENEGQAQASGLRVIGLTPRSA